jgi:hypothetical protein
VHLFGVERHTVANRLTTGRLLVLSVVALTAAFLALVGSGLLRLEVPGQHWFAPGPFPWLSVITLPIAALVLLAVVTEWALMREPLKRAPTLLIVALSAAFLVSIGTRITARFGFGFLSAAIICDGSNSYFTTVLETPDPLALAREWPQRMPKLRLHCTTQAPGAMLLHAALRAMVLHCDAVRAFCEALLGIWPAVRIIFISDVCNGFWGTHLTPDNITEALWVALVFAFAGASAALPLYGATRLIAGVRPAMMAAVLWAVTPSLIWYTPSIDQLYPLLAACIVWCIVLAVRRRSWPWLLPAGLLIGAGMFCNFGFGVMGVLGALLIGCLERAWRGPGGWMLRSLAPVCLLAVGAVAGLHALCGATGVDYWGAAKLSADIRKTLYQTLTVRPYLTWVLLNPVEFAIGLGFSSVALVGLALVRWRELPPGSRGVLGATLVTLVLLNLTGTVRAEVSRMLLYTMPLLLMGACGMWRRLFCGTGGVAALVLAQGLYLIVGNQYFEVWGYWARMFR